MKRKLNVALIGHKFMGKAHSNALRQVAHVFDLDVEPIMKVLCGVGDDLEETAEKYGWETVEPDWKEVVSNPEIDCISICTPGALHAEIAIEAAKNGKHILCEKPLSNTLQESKNMTNAVNAAGVVNVCNFVYRKAPAVILAKKLIEEGKLGNIQHYRALYMQDWAAYEKGGFVWRFDNAASGGGALADMGSHIIDLGRFLVGEYDEVTGMDKIMIPYKENPSTGVKTEVTSNDCGDFLASFKNGATGVFQTSRISVGRKNWLDFEINGSLGSIHWNLERMDELEIYIKDDSEINGFRTVVVTEPYHSYIKAWWPSGHIIGWEHLFVHQYYEFFRGIAEGNRNTTTTFEDGLKTQQVIEGLFQSSKTKQWVKI